MKILQIFNRYAYVGGEEFAVEQISKELAANHDFRTITFDSQEWAANKDLGSRIRQFISMAWNPGAIELVRKEMQDFQPDVILLHNIMPVGSAALYMFLADSGVPVVQFIHNFRPFSVNGYCWGNGKLLPQGLKRNYIPEIIAGSWQNSRFKTGWYALLIWLLHRLGVYEKIDGWIAISQFMKKSFIEGGIEEEKIAVISHSWQPQCTADDLAKSSTTESDPEFLFLGRLTEEKGILVLLDAWDAFEKTSMTGRLTIAGDGPLADEINRRCRKLNRASFVGFKEGPEKSKLLKRCAALVVPSIWWEPLGLVLYEAYDHGKPVIAARSGGIVDHVTDGVTGWLHDPGNAKMLADQMLEAASAPETRIKMGTNGRKLLLNRSAGVWIDEFDEFVGRIVSSSCANPANPLTRTLTANSIAENRSRLHIQVYLADQNPGYDRSYGISRMSLVVLDALKCCETVTISTVTSQTSQQAPASVDHTLVLPWGTRRKWIRLLTDHFHPICRKFGSEHDLHYFPKGYLPLLSMFSRPSVVTIHDTIIQYDEDHYPHWRRQREYAYWSLMLKHTLRSACSILTVSEFSKRQIREFMDRHGIPPKEITVTYEPCLYESIPQPENPDKENFVIHLASCEPHKRTSHLIRWWHQMETTGHNLPMLHLIGTVPPEVAPLLTSSRTIVKRPFLEDTALKAAYLAARALILPSEIEGFGLPALEAYYLGTPVCYVRNTSVEEILAVATCKGGFSLDSRESLHSALSEVMSMDCDEIRTCGLKLRETYAAEKVAEKMLAVFREVKTR